MKLIEFSNLVVLNQQQIDERGAIEKQVRAAFKAGNRPASLETPCTVLAELREEMARNHPLVGCDTVLLPKSNLMVIVLKPDVVLFVDEREEAIVIQGIKNESMIHYQYFIKAENDNGRWELDIINNPILRLSENYIEYGWGVTLRGGDQSTYADMKKHHSDLCATLKNSRGNLDCEASRVIFNSMILETGCFKRESKRFWFYAEFGAYLIRLSEHMVLFSDSGEKALELYGQIKDGQTIQQCLIACIDKKLDTTERIKYFVTEGLHFLNDKVYTLDDAPYYLRYDEAAKKMGWQ